MSNKNIQFFVHGIGEHGNRWHEAALQSLRAGFSQCPRQ